MSDWWSRFVEWWVWIPVLLGSRGRCPRCANLRGRAFAPGDPGYDTAKPSIYAQPRWARGCHHGSQPADEDCSGCGAPPGIWRR